MKHNSDIKKKMLFNFRERDSFQCQSQDDQRQGEPNFLRRRLSSVRFVDILRDVYVCSVLGQREKSVKKTPDYTVTI